MTVLYGVSLWVLLAAAIVAAVAIASAGHVLVRRLLPKVDFIQHNQVAGFLVAVVGTLYAVSLAFVTSIVWTEYDAAQTRVAGEAASLSDAWHLSAGFPDPVRAGTRISIERYAHEMIDREWPAMRRGLSSRGGGATLDATIAGVSEFRPGNPGATNAQALVLGALTRVHDARQYRLGDNLAGVAPFQWTVMLIGAVVVLLFCFLFGARQEATLLFMNAAVAVIIVTTWVLIFSLDYPFRGDLAITPQPFQDFLATIAR